MWVHLVVMERMPTTSLDKDRFHATGGVYAIWLLYDLLLVLVEITLILTILLLVSSLNSRHHFISKNVVQANQFSIDLQHIWFKCFST